jgi:hypothetical protein
MFSFPLKQTTIDYFKLNLIHNTVNNEQLAKFLMNHLQNSGYPTATALDIWDKFVTTNDDFFDTLPCWTTKEKLEQYRNHIAQCDNVYEIASYFASIGVSPFCNRHQQPTIRELGGCVN